MKKITFSSFPTISVFPFREVLGLDLKILFHKNKEIERMLSKKMTFSLMSLITLLAFAFVVPSAVAQKEFKVTVEGRTAVSQAATGDTKVTLKVTTDQPVADPTPTAKTFGTDGLEIPAYEVMIEEDTAYAMRTAKVRRYTVTLPNVVDTAISPAANPLPYTIYLTVAAQTTTDPTVADTDKANVSKPVIHKITLSAYVDTADVPQVVSIQRLRPGSQTVVAAFQEVRIPADPFNVRIVLTAPPHGIDLADVNNFIEVENGTVSGLVTGVPFERFGLPLVDTNANGNPRLTGPGLTTALMGTYNPHPIEGMYEHGLNGVPPGVDGSGTVPEPNGVDDMYRQYRVTITPHQKSADFDVKVRVKSFHDNGAVIRYTYLPPGFADSVHLPNGRDILTIPVSRHGS